MARDEGGFVIGLHYDAGEVWVDAAGTPARFAGMHAQAVVALAKKRQLRVEERVYG